MARFSWLGANGPKKSGLVRLFRSRGFSVLVTLAVLGTIVWGIRNAAPRGGPVQVSAASPTAPVDSATSEAANPEAAADPAPERTAAPAASSDNAMMSSEPPKLAAEDNSPAPAAVRPTGPDQPAPAAVTAEAESAPLAAPAAPETPSAVATPPTEAPKLTFKDDRVLIAPVPAPPAPAAAPSFRDPRALAAPSFQDKRPVYAPSFRDGRELSSARPPKDDAGLDGKGEAADPKVKVAAAPPAPQFRAVPVTTPAPSPDAARPQSGTGGTSTLIALSPSTLRIDGAGCGAPEVTAEPMDGGMMRIRVAAACRPNEAVQISYGGAEMIRRLDAWGALDLPLDCFVGASSSVELRFADGSRKTLPVTANDLDKVSKVAAIWRAPVNLDLHVFEYGAALEAAGHVWAKAPGSAGAAHMKSEAERRGHGFLSAADGEQTLGDKVEVYTFFHNDQQASGSIALALDYETRGESPSGATCGRGALAEVDFRVVILPRGGQPATQSGLLTRVDCGTRISKEARYNQSALPALRIRR
jgi:hypothetical protein